MTNEEANEVLRIVNHMGPVILSTTINPSGTVGSALRRAVGMMMSDPNMINPQVFAIAFMVCLELARMGSATLVTMDRVRKAALNESPVGLPAVQTVLAIVRLTLACEARIISFMTFQSREDVEAVATAVNAVFTQTSEIASDDLDSATYIALISLHADVVKHLADRGRQLPRVINYQYQTVMPALRMAQLAYADGSRYQELIAENNVIHPAFMPLAGKMLAV
jgi:prophage DNA circulation protein